jgi:hypothetical protein
MTQFRMDSRSLLHPIVDLLGMIESGLEMLLQSAKLRKQRR